MSKLSWTLLLIASMAAIAALYPILKMLDGAVEPLLLAFFRLSIAAIVLLPVVLYKNSFAMPPKKDLALYVLIAACSVVTTALLVVGIGLTNSIAAAILINANPLIIAALSPLLIGEDVHGRKKVALVIGFLGVVLVVLNGHAPAALLTSEYFFGSLILIFAAIVGGISKIYSRDLVRKYDGLHVTFIALVIGSLLLAVVVGAQNGFAAVSQFAPSTFFLLLALGVVCTAVPWAVWNSSLKHLDVHVAASFSLLIPILAAMYSLLFFNETFTAWILAGMLLTSIGLYFVQREAKVVPTV